MSSNFAIYSILIGTISGTIVFGFIYGMESVVSGIKSADMLLLFGMLSVFSIKYLISNSNWRFIKDMLLHNRILRDDNRELDLRLASREDRIRKLLNWKMEVMNNFSHEVRTPLHTTGNYLEIAAKNISEDKKTLSIIEDARKSFANLEKYILRLADLSEFQKKNMLLDMERADLMDILESLKEEYFGKIDIKLFKNEDVDSLILCDKLKLRMMFRELIDNSILHAKANFINIKVRGEEGSRLKVEYGDMPSRMIENKIDESKLFSPFEVGENGEMGYKGLGLAIAREIMHSHGGNISAKWEAIDYGFKPPKYAPDAYLSLSIEFAKENDEHNQKDSKDRDKSGNKNRGNFEAKLASKEQLNAGQNLKFLLVDDDENILKATSLMLESEGYEVYSVAGGRDAINFIEAGKHDIDVLLLDIMMPDKDGFEVLESVSDILNSKNIKTIFQSGISNIDHYREKLQNYRGILFCQKPYKLSDLKSIMSKF
jgi:two-component system chemotaxis sensor kinase CheA